MFNIAAEVKKTKKRSRGNPTARKQSVSESRPAPSRRFLACVQYLRYIETKAPF